MSDFRLGHERRGLVSFLDLDERGTRNTGHPREGLHAEPPLLACDGDRATEID
jgi:hypothetical protein